MKETTTHKPQRIDIFIMDLKWEILTFLPNFIFLFFFFQVESMGTGHRMIDMDVEVSDPTMVAKQTLLSENIAISILNGPSEGREQEVLG